jgi:hypothetical protein
MKKNKILAALFAISLCAVFHAVPLAAQVTAGLGVEVNNNNPSGTAMGFWAAADAWFFPKLPRLALGMRFEFSSNFGVSNTLEGAFFARWALWRPHAVFWIAGVDGRPLELFIHAGAGFSAIWRWKQDYVLPLFEGGAGLRIPLAKRGYVEITGRGGYPFLWGAGLSGGLLLGVRKER